MKRTSKSKARTNNFYSDRPSLPAQARQHAAVVVEQLVRIIQTTKSDPARLAGCRVREARYQSVGRGLGLTADITVAPFGLGVVVVPVDGLVPDGVAASAEQRKISVLAGAVERIVGTLGGAVVPYLLAVVVERIPPPGTERVRDRLAQFVAQVVGDLVGVIAVAHAGPEVDFPTHRPAGRLIAAQLESAGRGPEEFGRNLGRDLAARVQRVEVREVAVVGFGLGVILPPFLQLTAGATEYRVASPA